MKTFHFLLPISLSAILTFAAGCGGDDKPSAKPAKPEPGRKGLAEARSTFKTTLTRKETEEYPTPEPPAELFNLVKYAGPLGDMDAYITVDPDDGKKHPAIIWIVGGFGNSISEAAWEPGPADNDQSASTFWKSGIITMYPSLRGGNESPGLKEGLFGEVDDVIAAARHLAKLDYVDPDRIYLGGHSVGGTLALLVAESTEKFRAVFSFGPVHNTSAYGEEYLPYDVEDNDESIFRAPILWLHSIKNPTFVFEGEDGNIGALKALDHANKNPLVETFTAPGADHFGAIQPVSKLVAKKILEDIAPGSSGIEITPAEIALSLKESD